MKTKIFMLVLVFGMVTMQVEARELFKQVKQLNTVIQKARKGQNGQVFDDFKSSSDETSQSSKDEVTLIVSADGATKDEATKVALRSAIEQAYGTFVSANTTILNDELVKDEIVTVSTGNIKDFKEISCEQMPSGKFFVTLQATVSVFQLISYAKSKGAETEFAGVTFAINLRMKELNKQNESKVLDNMFLQLNSLSNLFDFEMELGEPKFKRGRTVSADMEVMDDISLSEILGGNNETEESDCIVEGTIYLLYNANTQLYNDIIFNTLSSLSLSEDERKEYVELGIPYYSFFLPEPFGNRRDESFVFYLRTRLDENKFLTNESGRIDKDNYLLRSAKNFVISDNISSPTKLKIEFKGIQLYYDGSQRADPFTYYKGYKSLGRYLKSVTVTGKKDVKQCRKIGDRVGSCPITIYIPKGEVAKYSVFKIEAQ